MNRDRRRHKIGAAKTAVLPAAASAERSGWARPGACESHGAFMAHTHVSLPRHAAAGTGTSTKPRQRRQDREGGVLRTVRLRGPSRPAGTHLGDACRKHEYKTPPENWEILPFMVLKMRPSVRRSVTSDGSFRERCTVMLSSVLTPADNTNNENWSAEFGKARHNLFLLRRNIGLTGHVGLSWRDHHIDVGGRKHDVTDTGCTGTICTTGAESRRLTGERLSPAARPLHWHNQLSSSGVDIKDFPSSDPRDAGERVLGNDCHRAAAVPCRRAPNDCAGRSGAGSQAARRPISAAGKRSRSVVTAADSGHRPTPPPARPQSPARSAWGARRPADVPPAPVGHWVPLPEW